MLVDATSERGVRHVPDTKKTTQCQALVHVAVSGPFSEEWGQTLV